MQDGNILSKVQGFKIPFPRTAFYHTVPQTTRINQEEGLFINSEIQEILRKGTIQQVQPEPGQLLSNLFLVDQKDGGHGPLIILKYLKAFIPYQHSKMEDMYLLKELPQKDNSQIKLDLKHAYFGIPLDKT